MGQEALSLHGDGDGDEAELVARAQAGDPGAWATLIESHWGQVWSLSWAVIRDRPGAESIVQETFRVVKEKLAEYRGQGSLRGWILTICRHQALDEVRRRRRRAREVPITCVELSTIPQEDEWIARIDLARALAALSSAERGAILLTAAGYTSDEMADALGVAPTTVRSRRASAREKLLLLLDGYREYGR